MAVTDFSGAANRHLRDAHLLKDKERWANAAYLSGYVVECALKALLARVGHRTPHIHDLSRLRRAVLDVAGGRRRPLNGIIRQPFSLPIQAPNDFEQFQYPEGNEPVQEWHPSLRYQPDDVVSAEVASRWVDGARRFFRHTVKRLERRGGIRE